MKKIFFVDFDGTITKVDVVAAMVKKFCRPGWQELNEQWERGEISTEEAANKTFQLFDATMEDIFRLMDTIELDEYFHRFIDACSSKNYPVFILSDGYEIIIRYILQKHGLNDIQVFANKLVNRKDGFSISCTYMNNECQKCGTCKTKLLHQLKPINTQAVVVGDGHSDTCVCHQADVVFAKKSLLEYCRQNNIKAVPYRNFKDILDWLKRN